MIKKIIEVKKISPTKGWGVFALTDFKSGEIIEKCPTLHLDTKERKHCEKTMLANYMYPWHSTRSGVVVWGYGSIYNHSFHPNADWKQNFKTGCMIYRAIRSIRKGEEITVNYNGEPDDMKPIEWFEVE